MAESRGVWGIEIGQAGLKAIRLRYAEAAKQVIAVGFDYVEHPKILSQPDAIPEELIPQALETFLSRNDLAGDKVCISVPGQSALARFIQLPPVESHRVAEIVKYEARQQIPFDLDDVIWDFQNLGGGVEESGYVLEAEVGLFAMKKEQVHATLQPFIDRKVEVEVIQIAPLALYNMIAYDQMGRRLDDPQPGGGEHTIVIDMGADNSTLVVSNGEKIWIRNVPIGGNHFTRALTKEMKLTFAKAEHLKCTATKSQDPRAVFQALRPVFNDYVSEIQRSIGYFASVNRDATIKTVIGVGNGFKLAGLQKFLQQNLQYDVERIDTFKGIVGDNVLADPVFQENVLGFAVPYGLALQGLEVTPIHTSLLPPEIARAREIRRKKPWALVTAASLLVGFATSVAVGAGALGVVQNKNWDQAKSAAKEVKRITDEDKSAYEAQRTKSGELDDRISKVVEPHELQFQWLELYKAVYDALPHAQGAEKDLDKLHEQTRMKVTSVQVVPIADLKTWWDANAPAEGGGRALGVDPADKAHPPSGPGYVVRVEGQHYHHIPDSSDPDDNGIGYVTATYLKNLKQFEVRSTTDRSGATPVRDIGISHPILLETDPEKEVRTLRDPRRAPTNGGDGFGSSDFGSSDLGPGRFGPGAGNLDPEALEALEREMYVHLRRTTFGIEFAWVPQRRSDRMLFSTVRPLLEKAAKESIKQNGPPAAGAEASTIQEVTLEQVQQVVQARLQREITSEEFEAIKTRFLNAIPVAAADAGE